MSKKILVTLFTVLLSASLFANEPVKENAKVQTQNVVQAVEGEAVQTQTGDMTQVKDQVKTADQIKEKSGDGFVDADGDGINDKFVDANGDGVNDTDAKVLKIRDQVREQVKAASKSGDHTQEQKKDQIRTNK